MIFVDSLIFFGSLLILLAVVARRFLARFGVPMLVLIAGGEADAPKIALRRWRSRGRRMADGCHLRLFVPPPSDHGREVIGIEWLYD